MLLLPLLPLLPLPPLPPLLLLLLALLFIVSVMIAHKRLARELATMQRDPPSLIHARPLENNILHFHYVLEGPPGTPYAGGAYHGVLKFPCEYPHKAPSVLMYTPSGRFQTNTRICMSM